MQFLFDLPAGKEGFRPIKMTAFVLPCPPVWYFDEGETEERLPSDSITMNDDSDSEDELVGRSILLASLCGWRDGWAESGE